MNQPPQNHIGDQSLPDWRRPHGVAHGTWQYVNQRSIAVHYDDFVADTPLCTLDERIVQETFPLSPKGSRQTIVDLGCGTGRTAIPLARAGYNVIGVDLSESMLEQLVSKSRQLEDGSETNPIAEIAPGNIQPLRANLVELNCLADQSVDHAVCLFSTLGMINGHANRESMLQHVSRIVRPGGRFVVHVHHRWAALHEPGGWRKLARSWWKSLGRSQADFGDSVYQYRGLEEMFMHRFSRRELTRLLTSCGWKIDYLHLVSIDGASVVKSLRKAGGFIAVVTNTRRSTPGQTD
ncbi:MAG: class I SAM-dependent methyltransferase [Pirellulaceae bacterium]